jgi:hypothetical protein
MPIQRPILSLLSMLGLLCCLQFAACGNRGVGRSVHGGAQGTPVAAVPSDLSQSTIDHSVPPVVLHDPAPGELEVVFNVNMPGYGADRGNTMIGLSFLSHGNVVQLVGHEQLMCNGKAMPVHQQYALFQLVDAPSRTLEGQTMSCTYRVSNTSTTFSFRVPRAPVIRSPQDGARVPRSTHTIVIYDYDAPSGKLFGVVALGPGAKALSDHLNTPGPMQATLDTSAFPTGEGSLSLTQALTPRVALIGTPFRSLDAEGTATAQLTVTWI